MPPKEENTGLLSKVVKFVKNPTTNWADLDQQDSDRESSYSKQMLKEMIERKRRNDFVRKREFDMLRKMRRSEVMAGQDPAARPSFFQSSMPSKPDDRATTLKKIDEIEAQMSMQWWKTKHGETSSRSPISANAPMSSHVPLESPGRPVAVHGVRQDRTAAAGTRPGKDRPGGTGAHARFGGAARVFVHPRTSCAARAASRRAARQGAGSRRCFPCSRRSSPGTDGGPRGLTH